MSLANGTKLGPYLLIEKIGAGGMGEVYRAQDTRLDRTVAVKVLLASVSADPERLRRFEQEARTLAALNHPNILAVHDLGTHLEVRDGKDEETPYLVSEFLEGETLREKLDAGPLPVRRALDYALGIAQGLAAGHGKGIVHRDIKPENIFLTADGQVKILDFGLAKLVQAAGGSTSDTLLTSHATQAGVVLGTVGYMSPEQVRGEPAEATSDIFSFGAVLYEMLSGKRAFRRDTAAETMTAVLRENPVELTATGWSGPPGLQRVVERCLEKQPRQRFQSASDLAFAIEALGGSGSGFAGAGLTGTGLTGTGLTAAGLTAAETSQVGLVPAAGRRRIWRYAWIAVPLLVMAIGLWMARRVLWTAHEGPTYRQVTFQRGNIPNARFTKDGQTVLYGGQFDNDPLEVYSVRVTQLQPVKVSTPGAALFSVSSTDQMAVGLQPVFGGHYLRGVLAEVPITGGAPRSIQEGVVSADYSPDGTKMAVAHFGKGKCVLEYPAGSQVFETNGYLDHVRISPDGKSVAFNEHPVPGDDRGFVSMVDAQGKARRLTGEYDSAQGVAWAPDGKEIWFSAGAHEHFDLFAVNPGGKLRRVVGTPGMVRLQDIASDGRVLLSMDAESFAISAGDAEGKVTPHLELYNGSILSDLTPDGKAIVFEEFGGPAGTNYEVVYRKTDGSPALQLGEGALPLLSPDGKTVAATLASSPAAVVLHPLGAGQTRTIPLGQLTAVRGMIWFPDNSHLGLLGAMPGQPRRMWKLDLATGKLETLGPEHFGIPAIAADGKQAVGYFKGQVVMVNLATMEMHPLNGVMDKEGVERFTNDGKGVFLTTHDVGSSSVARLDIATGKRTLLKTVVSADRSGVWSSDVLMAGDEKSYAYWEASTRSVLYVVDGLR